MICLFGGVGICIYMYLCVGSTLFLTTTLITAMYMASSIFSRFVFDLSQLPWSLDPRLKVE